MRKEEVEKEMERAYTQYFSSLAKKVNSWRIIVEVCTIGRRTTGISKTNISTTGRS